MIEELTIQQLDAARFIKEQVKEISAAVGSGTAINALSGGVDSSTVTMLGHRALGERLKTVFIENGLMRQGEPERQGASAPVWGSVPGSWTTPVVASARARPAT